MNLLYAVLGLFFVFLSTIILISVLIYTFKGGVLKGTHIKFKLLYIFVIILIVLGLIMILIGVSQHYYAEEAKKSSIKQDITQLT